MVRKAASYLPPATLPKAMDISPERFRNWYQGRGIMSKEQRSNLQWIVENGRTLREAQTAGGRRGTRQRQKVDSQFGSFIKEKRRQTHARGPISTRTRRRDWQDLYDVFGDIGYDHEDDTIYYH